VLVVYAISELPLLQRLFNRRPIEYLGKISFSLYLVHQPVYHLVRDPVINILWYIATREQYPGAEDASKLGGSFAFTWLAGYVVMSAINLYTAHLYTKYVDERCVRMAKRIDKWLTRPWPICIYVLSMDINRRLLKVFLTIYNTRLPSFRRIDLFEREHILHLCRSN
jgi:peptidoglycan/LPS O-acetylase OafA/YrhL